MIRTEHLSKFYNGFKAVQDLNLHVRAGEIYGFLGPNGAGKTTTLSMLLGITRPTRGRVWLFERQLSDDAFAIKRRIGVVSERQYLYDDVSAQEYLEFFAALYRVPSATRRIDALLEAVQLSRFRAVLARDYSNGMKQKLGLARALLHDPDVLILDEPVSGLDPHGIRQVRNIVLEQRERGKAILISSHVLSEIERTADRVGIIHRGRLLAEDRMDNLRRRLQPHEELEIEAQGLSPAVLDALRSVPGVSEARRVSERLIVRTPGDRDYRAAISTCLTTHGAVILAMRRVTLSLEEAFVTITADNLSLLTDAGGEA